MVQVVAMSLGVDDMGGEGLDIAELAAFSAYEVTVAHQGKMVAIDANDAVYDIAAAIYPSQYNVANHYIRWLLQDDALAPADDEWQHATSFYGQRHTDTVIHQFNDLGNKILLNLHLSRLLLCFHKSWQLPRRAGIPDATLAPLRPASSLWHAVRRLSSSSIACR